MLTDVTTQAVAPHTQLVREALSVFTRIEERMAWSERIARIEARLEQLDGLEERIRALEQGR